MFDKLVTVNYRRGLGGEFFCHLLDAAYSDRKFEQDTSFGTFNRYEYVGVDFIFKTFVHHFFWCTFSDYPGIEEYVDGEFGYPNRYNVSLRKNLSIKRMDNLISHYNLYIKEPDKKDQILNIKEYIGIRCSELYDQYFEDSGDPYAVSNIHYNSSNRYNLPLGYFFEGSKNVSLINTKLDEYFYTLLWIYKRLPDLKYYPAQFKSSPYKYEKQALIDYFQFHRKKDYTVFPGELAVEAFDLQYRGLNIDEPLSDLLNFKVRLDYDRIKRYAEANRKLMIDNFGFDVYKDYEGERVYDMFAAYVDRVYEDI